MVGPFSVPRLVYFLSFYVSHEELPGHLMLVVAIVNKGLLIHNFFLIIVMAYQKEIDLCMVTF